MGNGRGVKGHNRASRGTYGTILFCLLHGDNRGVSLTRPFVFPVRFCFSLSFEIYPRLSSLRMLKLPPDMIQSSVLYKLCPRLLEPKRDIVFNTHIANFRNPIEMAGTGFIAGLAANYHLLYPCANIIRTQVNFERANRSFLFSLRLCCQCRAWHRRDRRSNTGNPRLICGNRAISSTSSIDLPYTVIV